MLLDCHHGSKSLDGSQGSFLLEVNDISGIDLFVLGDTLDGHSHRVSRSSRFQYLSVLFNGKDLLSSESRWSNSNDIARADGSLLNASSNDLTDSLNVVNIGNGESQWCFWEALGWTKEIIQCIHNGKSSHLLLGTQVGGPALVPRSLVGLFDQVVSVETRVGNEWNLLGLVSNQLEHFGEFFLDFVETFLGPVARVHLVDAHNDLLHAEQIQEAGMLTSLSLFDSHFWVGLGNGGFETALFGRDKQ
mmetsp:Transcript_20854/g.51196  ORF Transcript_20854/g.51196 Transcript_20854/m.51196 type:complete len:247 (-) Transcript_20854:400-1140(-)